MAQKAQNQRCRHAVPLRSFFAGAVESVHHGFYVYAVSGVGLGIEKDFGVQHVIGLGAGEIGIGHLEEILLGFQDAGSGVVNVEKTL